MMRGDRVSSTLLERDTIQRVEGTEQSRGYLCVSDIWSWLLSMTLRRRDHVSIQPLTCFLQPLQTCCEVRVVCPINTHQQIPCEVAQDNPTSVLRKFTCSQHSFIRSKNSARPNSRDQETEGWKGLSEKDLMPVQPEAANLRAAQLFQCLSVPLGRWGWVADTTFLSSVHTRHCAECGNGLDLPAVLHCVSRWASSNLIDWE